jgi:hypothetical protein
MVCAALSAPTRLIIQRPRPDSLTKAAGRPRVDHGGRGADGGEPCARRFLGCTRIGCADSPFRDDALIAATLADEASREDVAAFAVAHRVDANQVPVSRMHIAGVMPVAPDRRR